MLNHMEKSETKRIWFAAVGIMLSCCALVYQISNLQLTRHEHYATLSQHNHIRLLPIAPPRGSIYDRNGNALAVNRTAYHLEINPALAGDFQSTVDKLRAIIPLSDRSVDILRNGWKQAGLSNRSRSRVKLSDAEVAHLAVHLHTLDGVEIVGSLDRYYPHSEPFAHAIGYLGGIDTKDIQRFPNYRHYHNIGKIGIERLYEDRLRGSLGIRRTEVNVQGRIVDSTTTKPPTAGDDLLLALDMRLQQVAFEAMDDIVGAVVAINPKNGDVLALVSKPAYDPNQFIVGMSTDEYQSLIRQPSRPLFNRATQGQYAPGSTVKPMVALAGLEHHVITPGYHIHAGPHYSVPGHTRKFRDWRKEGHGWVNVRSSIAQSCDVFFYDLAYRTGINRLSEMMFHFGLGVKTNIDLDTEQPGLVPTRSWKKQQFNTPWFPEETVNTGIGQGYMLATPLQLAAAAVILANQGRGVVPRMVLANRASKGNWKRTKVKPGLEVKLKNNKNWDVVINGMIDAVHRPNGTAFPYIGKGMNYTMAGKTGTAQTFNLGEDEEYDAETIVPHLRDHALFIGFAPIEDPIIAIAVVAEHAGSGAKVAVPIARAVVDAHLKEKIAAQLSLSSSQWQTPGTPPQ